MSILSSDQPFSRQNSFLFIPLFTGFGFARLGLQCLYDLTIEVRAAYVICHKTYLCGIQRWKEPLDNYLGIEHTLSRESPQHAKKIVHRLQLFHPKWARHKIPLATTDPKDFIDKSKKLSRTLGLPLLFEPNEVDSTHSAA